MSSVYDENRSELSNADYHNSFHKTKCSDNFMRFVGEKKCDTLHRIWDIPSILYRGADKSLARPGGETSYKNVQIFTNYGPNPLT
jgi:hypothetical protein